MPVICLLCVNSVPQVQIKLHPLSVKVRLLAVFRPSRECREGNMTFSRGTLTGNHYLFTLVPYTGQNTIEHACTFPSASQLFVQRICLCTNERLPAVFMCEDTVQITSARLFQQLYVSALSSDTFTTCRKH